MAINPKQPILFEEDIRVLFNATTHDSDDRLILSLFWNSGAEASEIIKLKRRNIDWGLDPRGREYFAITFPANEKKEMPERVLDSTRLLGLKADIYIQSIIDRAKKLLPDELLLQNGKTSEWVLGKMRKLAKRAGYKFDIHQFRHSVFMRLARKGMAQVDLKKWGAFDASMYQRAVPAYVKIENQRRNSAKGQRI